MNNSFCPLPWMSLSTKPNGDLRICCHANTSQSKGIHKDENGNNYNIATSNLNETRNSHLVKEVRQYMIENKRHDMCIRCNREDDQGVRSRRQYERENWVNDFNLEHALSMTNIDGSIDPELIHLFHLDVRFGNLCNLKCRMCGPTDSSQWYDEYYEILGTKFKDSGGTIELQKNEKGIVFAVNDPYKWHQKEEFWLELENQIPYIKQYYFAGGEPFLLDRHYDLLKKIIEMGYADQVVIEYNTNLTNIPQRAWDIWKPFKKVNVGVSVDGMGKLNDYIRFPSKWESIQKNLIKMDNAEGNFDIWLASTIQIYNVLGILDLIKWSYEQDFKRVGRQEILPFITPHPLHNPNFFNIRALPTKAKELVNEKYTEFFNEMIALDNRFIKTKKVFDGYLNYMNSEDWSHLLIDFKKRNDLMDNYRKHKFNDVDPIISNMIDDFLNEKI